MTVEALPKRRVRRRQVVLDTEYVIAWSAPDCPWEALLLSEPGSEPAMSRQELLALRDLLADAIDQLDPRRRWVFHAVVIEQRPMREIASMMSLSLGMVHKLSVQAKSLLYEYLRDEPLVKEFLNR